ncbi:alginate lyase family protein [Polaribacter sp.]|uniref:alginate lyase family protein n=1 Tax=Polaribacter sp. TaxID=1920175 RepID=UPI003F4A9A51
MEKTIFSLIIICFLSATTFSNSFIGLDSLSLAKTKKMIANGTASIETRITYQKLISKADVLLKSPNPTVMHKTLIPPTRDKHDYLSISRYWWPNPDYKDGLPWTKFDGLTNPITQTDDVDRKRLGVMSKGVWTLSLAYYFTNNEMYAQKAISMIETWFINPNTLMNPHLEFAQSVPGIAIGRPSGILDGRTIVRFVPDAIHLLSTSKHWLNSHQEITTDWFSEYLTWLKESDLGIKGSKQENNHGSWYKYQVASLGLFLGDTTLTKKTVQLAQKSLDNMLDDKGGQPLELARTRPFFYSCFNLQALANIAVIADKIGIDMWHYETDSKKSLALAINYLTPVLEGKEWHNNMLDELDYTALIPIVSEASKKVNTEEYNKILSKIIKITEEDRIEQNEVLDAYYLFKND